MKDYGAPLAHKVSGGHKLAQALKAKGVRQVFTLSGGFVNPIFMGCLEQGIDLIGARSETEAGFMAVAMARATREPAVVVAEPSGFTNYVSAVADAYLAGDPVIFISASANMHHFDNGGFKELPQSDVVRSMTKYAVEVSAPERIGWFLDKAYDIANNHPKGPVQLTIPINHLFTGKLGVPLEGRCFDPARRKTHTAIAHPDDVAEVAALLRRARRPAIIAGAGVWYGHAEVGLLQLAERWGIPVFTPFCHIKAINIGHPQHMGLLDHDLNPMSRLVGEQADLILMFGGVLDFALNFGEEPVIGKQTTLVAVNATPQELSKNMLADIRICGDLQHLAQTLAVVPDAGVADPGWMPLLRRERLDCVAKYRELLTASVQPVHPLRMCFDVIASLSPSDVLVIDGGDIACWAEVALNLWVADGYPVGEVVASGPWEQMGIGSAYATAYKMARPDARVVLITGDGSLGLSPGWTSMETAVANDLQIIVVVSNNAQWGMIQEQQKAMWGKVVGTSLRDVDYHKVYAASGTHATLVRDPAELPHALHAAYAQDKPALIEVKTLSAASPSTETMVRIRIQTADH